jgi:hypothetical protein
MGVMTVRPSAGFVDEGAAEHAFGSSDRPTDFRSVDCRVASLPFEPHHSDKGAQPSHYLARGLAALWELRPRLPDHLAGWDESQRDFPKQSEVGFDSIS